MTTITYPMQIKQSILELGAAFEIGSTRSSVVGLEPNLVLRSTVRGRKRKHRQLEKKARQADMAFLTAEKDEETAELMQHIARYHRQRLDPDKSQKEDQEGYGHEYDYDPDDSVLIEIPPGKVCNVADDEPDNPSPARTPVLYLRNDHYQVCVQRPDPLLRVSEDLPKYQLPQLSCALDFSDWRSQHVDQAQHGVAAAGDRVFLLLSSEGCMTIKEINLDDFL